MAASTLRGPDGIRNAPLPYSHNSCIASLCAEMLMEPLGGTRLTPRPMDAGPRAPMWNPASGIFDPAQLRAAIVARGWTLRDFIAGAGVSRGCMYSALRGHGVTDRTAIRIFRTLSQRDPMFTIQSPH